MGHTFSNILVHVVFSTKERRPVIAPAFRPRLYKYMAGIARHEFGQAIQIGGVDNHVHALLSINPDRSIADCMRVWKCLSSRWVHEAIPKHPFEWQDGYAAFSVSASAAGKVVQYINDQEQHHRKVTFEEEFLAFLKRHNVQYDPRYVWD